MRRCGLDVDEGLEDAKDSAHFLRCGSNSVAGAVAEETAAAGGERGLIEVVTISLGGSFENVIGGAALGAAAFDAVGAGGRGRGGEGIIFL